jgi:hypothetical protein
MSALERRPTPRGIKLGPGRITEYLSRVVRRVHLRIHYCDVSLLIDEIADPQGITCPDIAASPISQSNFTVGIAQQFEWEAVFRGESSVRGDVVEADAKNDDAAVYESTVLVAEPATLAGSASRIRFGIEPQKNLAAT